MAYNRGDCRADVSAGKVSAGRGDDLIFIRRNTPKTKKEKENAIYLSREAYVKRFDMR